MDKSLEFFVPSITIFGKICFQTILCEIVLEWSLISDADVTIHEIFDIGLTTYEPDQLDDDPTEIGLFGRHERKSIRQIIVHLRTENATRPDTGTIRFVDTMVSDMLEKVEILAHDI
jgi:hypothetical protein